MFSIFRRSKKTPQKTSPEKNRQSPEFLGIEELAHFKIEIRRKAYKRSLGLTLNVNGRVCVSVPRSASLRQIREFVVQNTEWIEAQSQKYATLRATFPRQNFSDGDEIPFMGEKLRIRFVPSAEKSSLEKRFAIRRHEFELIVSVPSAAWTVFDPQAAHLEISPLIAEFYAEEAKRILRERLEFYAARLGVRPRGIRFGSQKTRWGSCSAKGVISLNWRLIIAPLEVIDYVVLHELAHLKYFNHSPEFWELVRLHDPFFEEHRAWLTANQFAADFLAKHSELHSA
jgi:predicted metal-dependent hydrolase